MMPMSASSERMAASASWLRRLAKLCTGRPRASASAFSASVLAPGLSGLQNTPAMVSPRARKASRTALPKSCWPMKAMRAMAILLFSVRSSAQEEVGGQAVEHHGEQLAQRLDVHAVRGARTQRCHEHAGHGNDHESGQVQV